MGNRIDVLTRVADERTVRVRLDGQLSVTAEEYLAL